MRELKLAPFRPKLLPGAREQIDRVLERLNLTPEKSLDQAIAEQRHLYSTRVARRTRSYFFKARLWDERRTELTFRNEIHAHRFLMREQPSIIRPFLEGGRGSPVEWALYEFYPGKDLSYFHPDSIAVRRLLDELVLLQSIPLEHVPESIRQFDTEITNALFPNHSIRSSFPYGQRFEDYGERLLVVIHERNQRTLLRERFSEVAPIIDRVAPVLSHGDFQPRNIVVGGHKPRLIDLEGMRIANPVSDLATLFVRSWQKDQWALELAKKLWVHHQKTDWFADLFHAEAALRVLEVLFFAQQQPAPDLSPGGEVALRIILGRAIQRSILTA